jgi:hypothetical protein
LVEFALALPVLVIMFMGVIETALALNAVIGINRASQQAALTASIMGNLPGTDCLILRDIEGDVTVPNTPGRIQSVTIERTAMVGNTSFAQNVYRRGGSMECPPPGGIGDPVTVPYTLLSSVENEGRPLYPETERCSVLRGCPGLGSDRSTVDNIGVNIRYRHLWATPLNEIMDVFAGGDSGWNISQRNIFRMEPQL